ncbi:MAG: hypothetical protein H6925_01250 [Holosporaceae bacterium]|nr:MAG: hypothetical protein H6925_01250 [Holosporaceae bacterium]
MWSTSEKPPTRIGAGPGGGGVSLPLLPLEEVSLPLLEVQVLEKVSLLLVEEVLLPLQHQGQMGKCQSLHSIRDYFLVLDFLLVYTLFYGSNL